MRRRQFGLLAAWLFAAFAVMPAATPQDTTDGIPTYHWAGRTFGIPLDHDRLPTGSDRPTHIQLFTRTSRGNWQPGRKLDLTKLDELEGGKKGILLKTDRDGTYDVAAQFSYADGSTNPRVEDLTPQRRVVIDTVPPAVRVTAVGNGVEWNVTDDNVDPQFAVLQCKYPQWTDWQTINDRPYRAADRYAWKLQPGTVLEVRVKGRDKAGNEAWSPIIRVPGNGSGGGGSDWLPRGGGDPLTAPGFGGAGVSNLPQPRIEYVNTLSFEIDCTFQSVGPSGIKCVHLYTLDDKGNWVFVKTQDVDIKATDTDRTRPLKHEVKKDGTYAYFAVPENGAGTKADQPRRGDPPMMFVEVDTIKPVVRITGIQVRPGTGRAPVVEISWEVGDPNLMAAPINLQWSIDKNAAEWKEIKYRLNQAPNTSSGTGTGRFSWEVPEQTPWKFWVRIRATDKAGNTGEFIYEKEVVVDLEKPAVGIDKIRGAGTPADKPPTPGGTTTGSPGGPGSGPSMPNQPGPDKYAP